jgi:hypothetical protein
MIDDLMDEPEYDEVDDREDEPDTRDKCHCPFCYCSVRTDHGVCDMCSQGAHQG